MSATNLVSFLDEAQRTIIGEFTNETDATLTITNPVVVNIVPQLGPNGQPSGQMALQLLPVYFREFQAVKTNSTVFTYPKSHIVMITFEGGFDFRLYSQYSSIFSGPVKEEPKAENTPILKLFED